MIIHFKKQVAFIFLVCICSFSFSQEDSIHSLFSRSKITSLYWDEGYSGFQQKNNLLQGGTIGYLCLVLNEKVAMGFGSDLYGKDINTGTSANNIISDPRMINSVKSTYLKLEFLLKPHRLINFSFPLKFCFSRAGLFDTLPPSYRSVSVFNNRYYYYHQDFFHSFSAGANIFINLFKPLSLGAGLSYNHAYDVYYVGKNEDYSNFSFFVFMRIKLDVMAYQKRIEERQREFWKQYDKQ